MKIVFNCCTKPAKFTHNSGVTLFKGEKPEVAVQPQVKLNPQPAADTVTISTKQPEAKAPKAEATTKPEAAKPECKDCKDCKDCKPEAKPAVKAEVKPEAVASK